MPEHLNPQHQLEYLTELRQKYEEALGNAQKTEDYSEAEKLKEELETRLTDLEKRFSNPEPATNDIEKVEKGETTYERAKEIMGKDFFGVEAIKKAFDMNVGVGNKVPYSEAELTRVSERGEEMLVYRLGVGLTMEQIVQRVKLSGDEGKLLFGDNDYQNEALFLYENPRPGWFLVGKDIVENSTGIDYIGQTRALRDHISRLGSLTEDELAECTNVKLVELQFIMASDWTIAAKKLSEMKINQNHRRTAVEALYDFTIRFKNTNERMLKSTYDWTNTLASGSVLVDIGEIDQWGAHVHRNEPYYSLSQNLGVVSVR
jgi:hypothetical protein